MEWSGLTSFVYILIKNKSTDGICCRIVICLLVTIQEIILIT